MTEKTEALLLQEVQFVVKICGEEFYILVARTLSLPGYGRPLSGHCNLIYTTYGLPE